LNLWTWINGWNLTDGLTHTPHASVSSAHQKGTLYFCWSQQYRKTQHALIMQHIFEPLHIPYPSKSGCTSKLTEAILNNYWLCKMYSVILFSINHLLKSCYISIFNLCNS
jgi:hypothetical protein